MPESREADGPDEEVSPEAEFFELLLDHLCVAGFDGYWKRLNPAWTRTLGWTTGELMERPLIEFAHPDDREAILAARSNLMQGEPLLAMTNRYRCKDGSYRWFDWRSVSDPDRQLVYAVARDVTEEHENRRALRSMERQLVLADRMASVGTLAAGVAHEVNNPLAYVTGNLDLILEELRGHGAEISVERLAEMATEARQGVERIRKIVRGLDTFSRSKEERRSIVDLEPLLELAIDLASNEIRHRARLVTDYGATPRVEADESRLGQVLVNLLVNAAQAVPEGGADDSEIRIVTSTDSVGHAVVEVFDTGPGIPEEALDRVFDPFFTTKPVGVGTGLGLSICHNIVTSVGGTITAGNHEGGGAVFRISLPPAGPALAPSPPSLVPEMAAPPRRGAILVVDDERSIGRLLGRILRDHEVTITTSAREALEIIDAGTHFDIILSDLMMPEMSGMELYDQLVERHAQWSERIIFITGGAFTTSANEFLDRIPNPCLEKPFEASQIKEIVERYLARPSPQAAHDSHG